MGSWGWEAMTCGVLQYDTDFFTDMLSHFGRWMYNVMWTLQKPQISSHTLTLHHAPDEDLIPLAMNQSLGRNVFHVDPVIHSVYDTLDSQEVRRLHSVWLICCHGDRNDTGPNGRQEKSGGLLDEWDKVLGDGGSVRSWGVWTGEKNANLMRHLVYVGSFHEIKRQDDVLWLNGMLCWEGDCPAEEELGGVCPCFSSIIATIYCNA